MDCFTLGSTGPTQYPLRGRGQRLATATRARGAFVWSQACIPFSTPAQIMLPSTRHTSGLTLNQLHKGAGDNGNRADGAAAVSPSPRDCRPHSHFLFLHHDIATDGKGVRLTLTNFLTLPRCHTNFQAISLSQLEKVADNLRAPCSSQMLVQVRRCSCSRYGHYDIFSLLQPLGCCPCHWHRELIKSYCI